MGFRSNKIESPVLRHIAIFWASTDWPGVWVASSAGFLLAHSALSLVVTLGL